jgi:hypothetical protein
MVLQEQALQDKTAWMVLGKQSASGQDGMDGATGQQALQDRSSMDGATGQTGASGQDSMDGATEQAFRTDGMDGTTGQTGASGQDSMEGCCWELKRRFRTRHGMDGATGQTGSRTEQHGWCYRVKQALQDKTAWMATKQD